MREKSLLMKKGSVKMVIKQTKLLRERESNKFLRIKKFYVKLRLLNENIHDENNPIAGSMESLFGIIGGIEKILFAMWSKQ